MRGVMTRFIEKLSMGDNGCWNWQGNLDRDGYGGFYYEGKKIPAHRFSYNVCNFIPLTSIQDTHHNCENRRCMNPYHLRAVGRREHVSLTPKNLAYRSVKFNTCINGHAFTIDTTYISPKGHKYCRICNLTAVTSYKIRKEAA